MLFRSQYKNYLKWVEDHFAVSSYFHYEKHMPNLEQYILNLDIFHGPARLTWKDTFGIEFKDWNRCHYLVSDLSGLGHQADRQLKLTHNGLSSATYELQSLPRNQIINNLSVKDGKFLEANSGQYVASYNNIQELVDNKILVTGVPIKLQTMIEKKLIIKNFDQCAETYNAWVNENGIGTPYSPDDLQRIATEEIQQWHTPLQLQ